MLRGELYVASDPEILADLHRASALIDRYNRTFTEEHDERDRLLRELLAAVGEDVVVRPPFYCDYGRYISIGDRTFINYDCVMLDGATLEIGADCQIAPRVQLVTATHPLEAQPRRDKWESVEPVVIGDNVWLGAGVIVCPGVTIGDDTVVAAGGVVTKDLAAGVLAAGVPATVKREIA